MLRQVPCQPDRPRTKSCGGGPSIDIERDDEHKPGVARGEGTEPVQRSHGASWTSGAGSGSARTHANKADGMDLGPGVVVLVVGQQGDPARQAVNLWRSSPRSAGQAREGVPASKIDANLVDARFGDGDGEVVDMIGRIRRERKVLDDVVHPDAERAIEERAVHGRTDVNLDGGGEG